MTGCEAHSNGCSTITCPPPAYGRQACLIPRPFNAWSIDSCTVRSAMPGRGCFSSIRCGRTSIKLPDQVRAALVCLTLNHGGAEHHLLKLGRALQGTRIAPLVIPL